MAETTFIYALLDPRGKIRYIGKADNPARRFYRHLRDKPDNRKNRWIQCLLKQGLEPTFEIIDEVQTTEWQAAEAAYILFYREQGCDLVNTNSGGTGSGSGKDNPNYGKKFSPEFRAKLSAAHKGKPWTAKQRAGCNPKKGWKHSAESRLNISTRQKGEKHHFFGKKHRPETIAKMRASQKGRKGYWAGKKFSAEHRAKIGRKGEQHSGFGKPWSPERRARKSMAMKAYFLRLAQARTKRQLELF